MDSDFYKSIPFTAIGARTFHPKRQNISFGRWAMPVMAKKIVDPDSSNRRRAVQSLCDYVFDSRRIASKEFESVVPQLKSIPQDNDSEVRLKAAECFGAIAASAAGRRVFEKYKFYDSTLKLAEDEDETIRQASLIAIQRVCLSPVGAELMVKAGAIQKLIGRIPEESDANLVPLLHALHFCCLVDPDEALKMNGLEILIPLLGKPCPKIQANTGTLIKDLTVEAKGRNAAVQLPAIPSLLELCLDKDDHVKAKALAALMMITNATEGKRKALQGEAIAKIFPLLKCEYVEVRLNATKVLTALGEAPEGRETLLKHFRAILRMLNDDYEEVQKAANRLIKVINFKP